MRQVPHHYEENGGGIGAKYESQHYGKRQYDPYDRLQPARSLEKDQICANLCNEARLPEK